MLFRSNGDGDGLRLEPGVLGQTNGVALLAQHGFGVAIQKKAERVAAWLAEIRGQSTFSEKTALFSEAWRK